MNDGFIDRIKIVLEHYDLGISAFADRIGIQRSSMSHILSGRNRPSLDFVMKLVQTFPEVNLYWLLNGKGHFPSTKNSDTPLPSQKFTSIGTERKEIPEAPTQAYEKKISKIVLFYTDGTFETFNQKKR
ncbi:MAG: helix-turn-helix transcriptional regulator [Bacteroidota bacterium]